MEVIIQPNPSAGSTLTARIVARLIETRPDAVLGLCTGKTPLRLYDELGRMHREEGLDFSQVTTFNLDEFVGVPANHPAAYHHYVRTHLLDHLNILESDVNIPNGLADDIEQECQRYEDAIRAAGGIDLQLLGIGTDGHIGFNEPGSSLGSPTRIKTLTPETRRGLVALFGSEAQVPPHVITMGIATILESRAAVLLAFGQSKAWAVAQAVEGPVSAMVPASALQLHPRAKVILDEEAASQLRRADYYRWVYAHKPAWQELM